MTTILENIWLSEYFLRQNILTKFKNLRILLNTYISWRWIWLFYILFFYMATCVWMCINMWENVHYNQTLLKKTDSKTMFGKSWNFKINRLITDSLRIIVNNYQIMIFDLFKFSFFTNITYFVYCLFLSIMLKWCIFNYTIFIFFCVFFLYKQQKKYISVAVILNCLSKFHSLY